MAAKRFIQRANGLRCPHCGGPVARGEGCLRCVVCGYLRRA